MSRTLRLNVGCGQTPTEEWKNFDNSFSIYLARLPFVARLLFRVKLIDKSQYQFIQFAQSHRIKYADVTKGLPLPADSVDVLYSSHMLEHLDSQEVDAFLKEAERVLRSKGVIRLAVPDLAKQVNHYIETGDADAFIARTRLCQKRPRTLSQRIKLLLVGPRHHQWMYDGRSLSQLLNKYGFVEPKVVQAGETRIPNPGPLDLHERADESVYVEAEKP